MLQDLGRVLPSWNLCQGCNNGKRCMTANCPWQRTNRLIPFSDYHKDLTASYDPDIGRGEVPAVGTHKPLFDIMGTLKMNPDITRAQLTDKIFNKSSGRIRTPSSDQGRAVNLAVRVMVMVNFSAQQQPSELPGA